MLLNAECCFARWAVLLAAKGRNPPFSSFQLPIMRSVCPPTFCRNYCCEMLLGICRPPKRISQQQFMQNLGGGGGKESALEVIGKQRVVKDVDWYIYPQFLAYEILTNVQKNVQIGYKIFKPRLHNFFCTGQIP